MKILKVHWLLFFMAGLLVVAINSTGCATPPKLEHSYVTDYQVIGDRSVKYIYRPGDRSEAGPLYMDQGLAVEICSLVIEEVEVDEVESVEGDDDGDEVEVGEAQEQALAAPRKRIVERDCVETRILKTEEYR